MGVEPLQGILSELALGNLLTGNPLPVNDVWIGTHALETGSVLVTYVLYFSAIPGLRLWDEL